MEGHSTEFTKEISAEEEGREDVPSAVIKEMYAKWGEIQLFAEKHHPDTL